MSKRDEFFTALGAGPSAILPSARDTADASGARASIMAICNVTPDSFSDGGLYFDVAAACAHIDRLLEDGADILDLGAESTRPGAKPVTDAEQLTRLKPVLLHAVRRGAVVSIDTQSPAVADACLTAGAHAVNDVSCLRDEALADVVARHDAALVLMHARGPQEQMAGFSRYPDDAYVDVVGDVVVEWCAAAGRALARGLHRRALVMDPGFGFSKNVRHNSELLARIGDVVAKVDVPVLVGVSRKSFLALADKKAEPAERLGASVAAAAYAVRAGVRSVRVHDVRATRQAIDLERALATLRKNSPADRTDPIASGNLRSAEGGEAGRVRS